MKQFEFAIIVSGKDFDDDAFLDAVYEAGCEDATLSLQKGVIIAEFSRESVSFSSAIASACHQLLSTGVKIERVEPDHLVTISEIAERSALSRQAISLYSKGKRGEGFPGPIAKVTSSHPLWDWYQVAHWLCEAGHIAREEVVYARVLKEANVVLESNDVLHDGFAERLEQIELAAA